MSLPFPFLQNIYVHYILIEHLFFKTMLFHLMTYTPLCDTKPLSKHTNSTRGLLLILKLLMSPKYIDFGTVRKVSIQNHIDSHYFATRQSNMRQPNGLEAN